MESQRIFHRFKRKYRLRPFTYRRLLRLLSDEMEMDAYGLHTISRTAT